MYIYASNISGYIGLCMPYIKINNRFSCFKKHFRIVIQL